MIYIKAEAVEEKTAKGTIYVRARIAGREDVWAPKSEVVEGTEN